MRFTTAREVGRLPLIKTAASSGGSQISAQCSEAVHLEQQQTQLLAARKESCLSKCKQASNKNIAAASG
jgi:hypothetical protein